MKLIFFTTQLIGTGGVERVLTQRLNYFVRKFNYDITVVTTEKNIIIYKTEYPFH